MDNNQLPGQPLLAGICSIIGFISGAFAAIIADIDLYLRCCATIAALVSAGYAAVYYRYAIKEKKQALKSNK